ncbi:MAG: PH domain-containing protein [Candidatus Phocaeicola faecigallinarum]|uniref:PH domain-containing protein n=1 Tax=Candidatus Phocaeicola faecigallinarum TaxID=2838732 RepID=A0A948WUY5_9BACT|nr:PH domain-containing protein [Candidatus Phocaeicola faecigallinarum]
MRNDRISFPCTWSMGVTAITAITIIILVASTYFIWTDDFPSSMLWLKYTLIVVFIATIIGGLGYMPIRLTIGNDKIILHRLFGAINISIKDIIEIKAIPNSETAFSIRIFGSGGLFGYLGKFKNKILGNYTMYATNVNELILIRTDRKTYVFSCKNRDEFIESVKLRNNDI